MNKISDKELIEQIFLRLDDNFVDMDDPHVAITYSEIAADALHETLFNMGMEDLYSVCNRHDENGIWFAKFEVK